MVRDHRNGRRVRGRERLQHPCNGSASAGAHTGRRPMLSRDKCGASGEEVRVVSTMGTQATVERLRAELDAFWDTALDAFKLIADEEGKGT